MGAALQSGRSARFHVAGERGRDEQTTGANGEQQTQDSPTVMHRLHQERNMPRSERPNISVGKKKLTRAAVYGSRGHSFGRRSLFQCLSAGRDSIH